MKKTFTKFNSGFTLVETLVAITILIIGVLGPLTLAARGISDGLFAQNQLTASLLAQEAIETIVNKRNSNILTNPEDPFREILPDPGWADPISNTSIDGASGGIDLNGCTVDAFGGTGCFLAYVGGHYINSATGQFFRSIIITPIVSGGTINELKVDVKIIWRNKSVDKSFSLSEYIYAK